MSHPKTSRRLRAALFGFSSALLLATAACSNTYGPPVAGQPVTWGQQHYLDNQRAQADHDSRRSNNSGTGGPGVPH